MMASAGAPGAQTGPNPLVRVVRAWRALGREHRPSAVAALALWITMFLPWYSVTIRVKNIAGTSLSAWSAFGLVQAFILVISLGTLAFLFSRGERRALGGQAGETSIVVLGAGTLASVLIIYGMFDRPGGRLAIASGIQWGIVIALLAAIWLAYTGLSAYQGRRGTGASDGASDGQGERRLTRREQSGDADTPTSARWVQPEPARRADADPAPPGRDRRTPREPEGGVDRAVARDDVSQLSLELPHDHFDE
jgi:hypothetical protein